MNREEAIKWLKAIEKKYIHGGDEEYDNLRKIALHMAMESLEQPEPKWIPVSEGLPEEADGTVLVCMPDEIPFNRAEPYIGARHNQQVITATYSQFSETWSCGRSPIAWMPLPEAYKEDKNE